MQTEEMKNIRDILTDIAQRESKRLALAEELSVGLLSGDMGSIVFLYEYSQFDKSYLALADDMFDKLLQTLRRRRHPSTYCSGVAGMAVGLHALKHRGFVDFDSRALVDFDHYVAAAQSFMLNNKHHDFLHGFIGLGFYWITRIRQRENRTAVNQLLRLVNHLERTCEVDKESTRWPLPQNKLSKPYNISISHGISSTIILLCELLKLQELQTHHIAITRMMRGAVNYVLRNQIDPERYGCWFASTSLDCERAHRGRLAWCYGDLGICVALNRASQTLGDPSLAALSKQVLEYTARHRRCTETNQVHDACLCHGAAGVGLVFREMAFRFGSPILAEAASYWRDVVCSMAIYEDDGATFPFYDVLNQRPVHRHGILEGDAGVALFLANEKQFSAIGSFLLINRME